MKSGVRALGIAESYRDDRTDGRPRSTLAGAVVRADRVFDGLAYGSCRVGGTDATDAVIDLIDDLERPDVRYVLLGAIAPAWYNVLDLSTIHRAVERPVLAVTFEASGGLEAGLRTRFRVTNSARLESYRAVPERRELSVNGETVYVRCRPSSPLTPTKSFSVHARRRPVRSRFGSRGRRLERLIRTLDPCSSPRPETSPIGEHVVAVFHHCCRFPNTGFRISRHSYQNTFLLRVRIQVMMDTGTVLRYIGVFLFVYLGAAVWVVIFTGGEDWVGTVSILRMC